MTSAVKIAISDFVVGQSPSPTNPDLTIQWLFGGPKNTSNTYTGSNPSIQAYRRQALRTHPDKGGSAEAFRRVLHAFEVLSSSRARAKYVTWRWLEK